MKKKDWIVGVDEVGRGSLAGPVTVCALLLQGDYKLKTSVQGGSAFGGKKQKLKLRDSKKLTENQREEWFAWIKREKKEGRIYYSVVSIPPKTVDRINVTVAANRAARRAIRNVLEKSGVNLKQVRIRLDGGIYPSLKTSAEGGPAFGGKIYSLKTVIKGDEKIPAISLASIVAKVTRDRYMVRLAKRFPKYRFEKHKGYGTRMHRARIKKHGISPHHRLTFLKKYTTLG